MSKNKKSGSKKISFESSSNLSKFFQSLKEQERIELFKDIFHAYGVEIKINPVKMVIVKVNGEKAKGAYDGFISLNKDKDISAEKVYKALRGELDIVSEESFDKYNFTLKHARLNSFTTIVPKTKKQAQAIDEILTKKVTLLMGSAGTGKSLIGLAVGLKLLELGKVKKIILSKPPVESGPSIGFLPGDEGTKLFPYIASVMGLLTELIGVERRDKLMNDGVIQVENVGFLRGMTLGAREGIYYLSEEAQNMEFQQHKLLLTRLGNHPESRIVITGDNKQSDLKYKKDTLSVIHSIIKDSPYVGTVLFEKSDIVRSDVVRDLLGRIEDYEDKENEKKILKEKR